MKTLMVEVPDDVYERAQRHAEERGTSLHQETAAFLAQLGAATDDKRLADARARMQELFRTVKGFRLAPKISREELYERGSLR